MEGQWGQFPVQPPFVVHLGQHWQPQHWQNPHNPHHFQHSQYPDLHATQTQAPRGPLPLPLPLPLPPLPPSAPHSFGTLDAFPQLQPPPEQAAWRPYSNGGLQEVLPLPGGTAGPPIPPVAASHAPSTPLSSKKRRKDTVLSREPSWQATNCTQGPAPGHPGLALLDGAKRVKQAQPPPPDEPIIISDDDEDYNNDNNCDAVANENDLQRLKQEHYPETSDYYTPAMPELPYRPPPSREPRGYGASLAADQNRPVDHNGRPLSDVALAVATEYWNCQREYDHCPFDAMHVEGPRMVLDPLIRMAYNRRAYTMTVLGLDELAPGSRTYEPPYIEAPKPVRSSENAAREEVVAGPPQSPTKPPRVEPVLCPEQAALVELAASGRNIFYTGSAGCGKSTVLHAIRSRLQKMGKRVEVVAPTGKVALAINGKTTWTFAGWSPDHHKRPLKALEKIAENSKTARKRFQDTDVLIIDEISMVENLHFERLNAIMKAARFSERDRSRTGFDARIYPFGNTQVIVTGDFCQLPPVKPFQHCITCGNDLAAERNSDDIVYKCKKCFVSHRETDKWAFRSEAWKECNFLHVNLNAIHRQNDGQFISMLQKCRLGDPFTGEEVDLLMNHHSVTANAVKLFSTREEVRRTNEAAFLRLRTEPHPYRCFDQFTWHQERHPNLERKGMRNPDGSLRELNDHRLERRIELKKGMLVVLLVNLDLTAGLCNGSQGIIAGFEPYDPEKLPRRTGPDGEGAPHASLKESHVKSFSEQQKEGLCWPVVKFHNGTTRVIFPECQIHELGDREPYSLISRTQVPLAAAWALSIHKAQGMTLDRVVVDLSRAFEEGQVYVALSRATSLEGLKVEGDPKGLAVGMGGNREVREFLREKFGL